MRDDVRTVAVAYVVGVLVFTAVDLAWLGVVAADLYRRELGGLLAQPARPVPAVAFYLLFVAGLVHFVVLPAVERGSLRWAAGSGAFFGLVTYATWDLTNLAVLEEFPTALVPVDLAWGAGIATLVSVASTVAVRRWGSRVGGSR